MDEPSALNVAAVRAVETTDVPRSLWSEDDRAWASRAAAEVVGADAAADAFVARRAALAIERLGARQPALARAVRAMRWRSWVGGAIPAAAFVLGVFVDQIGSAQRVNILAPPVLGLLVWNIAVYVAFAFGYVIRYGDDSTPGPLRSAIARVAARPARLRGAGGLRDGLIAFVEDWARRSAPLYAVRAARILHASAAALALGVVAGLYVRGLAFEYRATWESTFLDAPTVRSIVALAYWPGAKIIGIAVPDIDSIAAIHAPAGENAARWVHLMAATVAAVVVAPRLLLALACGLIERRRARRFAMHLDEPYFQRLLRSYRGGPARLRVVPYSYAPNAAVLRGLERVVARAFGAASIVVAPPIAYGADDAPLRDAMPTACTTIVALFHASATPEREVHGTFLAALARERGAELLLALVDESAWASRWASEPARVDSRRKAWRDLANEARVAVVFVDLGTPDLTRAEAEIDRAIAGDAQ